MSSAAAIQIDQIIGYPADGGNGCGDRSITPDFWQVGVVLNREGLAPQTSHRAWPPEGLCI
jgi:hypothetical protein